MPRYRPGLPARPLAPLCALALPLLVLASCDPPPEEFPGILVEDVGFQTPESVQHDAEADVYLVSNINGDPVGKDGDGFISRISPEGEVLELRWIDGQAEGVTLHAPKGMAFRGDTLYVADIDCVRGFHRETGEPVEEICIEGATFLNGLAVNEELGILYVTDTGMTTENGDFAPTGTDAVYQISADGEVSVLAQGEELGNPNGITYSPRGVIVASFGSGELYALHPDGGKFEMMPASDHMFDGLLTLPDQGFLISDWHEEVILRIFPDGTLGVVIAGVEAPGDIGFDLLRDQVLIPLLMSDAVRIEEIEVDPEAARVP